MVHYFKGKWVIWSMASIWHEIDGLEKMNLLLENIAGRVWCIGWVDVFRPKGHGFDSRSSCHVGTLGKSLTRNCLWRFGVKFRHSIRAVSGEPLSSSELEEAL